MKYIIEFIIVFLVSFLFYLFAVILRKKNKRFVASKQKPEESFLILKYNIDMKKINYRKFLLCIYTLNSTIFAFTAVSIQLFEDLFVQLLFAPIILFPLILISYTLIGKYYKKKGYGKDV